METYAMPPFWQFGQETLAREKETLYAGLM